MNYSFRSGITGVFLALCLLVTGFACSVLPVQAADTAANFVLAGDSILCGTPWEGSPDKAPDNVMTKDGDTYTITKKNIQKSDNIQFKIVAVDENGQQNWIGNSAGGCLSFSVSKTCDVTITYDTSTRKVGISGTGVSSVAEPAITSVTVTGNGYSNWLNGAEWDPASTSNSMKQVADDVWEIEYSNIPKADSYQFKFAVNGSWTDNFGGIYSGSGNSSNAVYKGEIINIGTPYENSTVTIRLDLTKFNLTTGNGARFTVTITETTPAEIEDPGTDDPGKEDPGTDDPGNQDPGTDDPGTDDPASETEFIDVRPDAYYAPAVSWAVASDITKGTAFNKFSPEAACTRAQMVTFLWRAAGSPEPTSWNTDFVDVAKTDYYYKPVLWAVERGITKGVSDVMFGAEYDVTRSQTVTFLYRYAGSPVCTGDNPFKDVSTSEYYINSVLWAVAENITSGTSEDTFEPDLNCSRCQIVTFLYRYFK